MITLSALYALQGHIFLSYVRDSFLIHTLSLTHTARKSLEKNQRSNTKSITTKIQTSTLKHPRYTTHRQHHVENNKITVCFGLGLKNVMPTARSKTPIRVRQLNGIILTRTRQNVDLCLRMRFKIFSSLSTSNSIRTYGTRRCVLGNEHVKSHHFKK